MQKNYSMSKYTISILFCFLLLSIFAKVFLLDIYRIPTASMQPTLNVEDKILLQKAFFQVKKNDIVAFYSPQNSNEKLIKRCKGLPLDTLILNSHKDHFLKEKNTQIADNQFFIIPQKNLSLEINLSNLSFYKPLIEQAEGGQIGIIGSDLYINGKITNTYTFQQNYYFMLGDNPSESYDSRQFGLVAENAILGKFVCKI